MSELSPTAARPGTAEKIAVMRQRNENELPLYHPRDAKDCGKVIPEYVRPAPPPLTGYLKLVQDVSRRYGLDLVA